MTDQTFDRSFDTGDIPLDWKWTFALGIILILGGIVAFLNPFIASLTVEAIAAAAFFIGGAMQLLAAIRGTDGTGSRVAAGLLGVLFILFAAALLINPIAGLVSLTLLVAAFFFAMGLTRIWIGWRIGTRPGRGWLIAAGAVSMLLGILIFAALPEGALALLGLFLGVELVSSGLAASAFALRTR